MSIDGLGRIIVASGHFADRVPHIIEQVARISPGIDRVSRKFKEISETLDFFFSLMKSERQERAKQQALDNLKDLGDVAKDLAEAYWWGRAGNFDEAQQKAVEGLGKMGEVFGRGIGGLGN